MAWQRLCMLVAVSLMVLGAPSIGRAAPGDAAPPALAEIEPEIAALAEQYGAGVSLAWIESGSTTWTRAYGWADIDAGTEMRSDHRFRVGSFAKSFIALAVLRLAEEGKLDLEAPIRTWIPDVEFENPWAETDPITVAHLLEHTAGFDELRFNEMFATKEELAWPLEQVLALNPGSRRVRWRPGTRHGYAQPHYTVAALIVERASGMPWDEYLVREVLAPLGIEGADWSESPQLRSTLATGHRGIARAPAPHILLHHRPGGQLAISAPEVARLVRMLLGGGVLAGERLYASRTIERLQSGRTMGHPRLGPSYGLGNYRYETEGRLLQGHGGWMPGFHSTYAYDPVAGRGFVLLGNLDDAPETASYWRIAELLTHATLDGHAPEPVAPEVDVAPVELERWVGTYRFANPHTAINAARDQLRRVDVSLREGRLWLGHHRDYAGPVELVALGDGHFRTASRHAPSLVFVDGPDGVAMVDGCGFEYFERIDPRWAAISGAWLRVFGPWSLGALAFAVLALFVFSSRVRRKTRMAWLGPAIAVGCLWAFVTLASTADLESLAAATPRSLAIFAASWGFAVATAGVVLAATRRRPVGWLMRLHVTLSAAMLTSAVVYLWSYGLIGLRTWVW